MISTGIETDSVELYPAGIINSVADVDLGFNVPMLYKYDPVGSPVKRTVFLIFPGGGYGAVTMRHEGHDVARRLAALGYTSFVLRYRLPNSEQMQDKRIAPLQDAQTAILWIRKNTSALVIDRIVVLGFSAGGHLASTLCTHHGQSYIGAVDTALLRPDAAVLVYPLISMDERITHAVSKKNLLGPTFLPSDVRRFSNELHVNQNTPPTFLVHAEDDPSVPMENAILYQQQLESCGVPNALYRFQKGKHGFGMYNREEEGDWLVAMLTWLSAL